MPITAYKYTICLLGVLPMLCPELSAMFFLSVPSIFIKLQYWELCFIYYSQIAGIQLTLNGVTYPNNSIVNNTDIGTGSAALICTTTLLGCCFSGHTETQWYFPNGSQVPNNPSLPYQRNRGRNPGRVILIRNSESTTTGIFHCDIPDESGVTQSLYVGIYDSGTGESCTLSSITGYLQERI